MPYRRRRGRVGSGEVGTIYVLHFPRPYRHAGHYIGWAHAGGLDERLRSHVEGRGNPLVYAACQLNGITAVDQLRACVAATETADRHRERQLKNRGGATKWCPVCREGNHHEHEQEQQAEGAAHAA